MLSHRHPHLQSSLLTPPPPLPPTPMLAHTPTSTPTDTCAHGCTQQNSHQHSKTFCSVTFNQLCPQISSQSPRKQMTRVSTRTQQPPSTDDTAAQTGLQRGSPIRPRAGLRGRGIQGPSLATARVLRPPRDLATQDARAQPTPHSCTGLRLEGWVPCCLLHQSVLACVDQSAWEGRRQQLFGKAPPDATSSPSGRGYQRSQRASP